MKIIEHPRACRATEHEKNERIRRESGVPRADSVASACSPANARIGLEPKHVVLFLRFVKLRNRQRGSSMFADVGIAEQVGCFW